MSVRGSVPPADDYRTWRERTVRIGGQSFVEVVKPGVLSLEEPDPATLLLCRAAIDPGATVVHLNAGGGLFGCVAAAAGARRIIVRDRHVVGVEAAARTAAANGVSSALTHVAHGIRASADVRADVVAIRLPPAKLSALQLIRDAFEILNENGRAYLAGASNEGIKPAVAALDALFGNATVLAHGSGHRVAVATKRAPVPSSLGGFESPYLDADTFHTIPVTLAGRALSLASRPGVFSWDAVDEASALLAGHMVVETGDAVLDLGCGYGLLGISAALRGARQVRLLDADIEAIRSAERSIAGAGLLNATATASDVASAAPGERFDVVVTNPPFHIGKSTRLDLPRQFIVESFEVLRPEGRLYLVANRTLPYERTIKTIFGNVATVHDGRRFKVLTATRRAP